jgi:hypothetical protein
MDIKEKAKVENDPGIVIGIEPKKADPSKVIEFGETEPNAPSISNPP